MKVRWGLRSSCNVTRSGSVMADLSRKNGVTSGPYAVGLPPIHETSSTTRASFSRGHLPRREHVHGGSDLRGVLLKILG